MAARAQRYYLPEEKKAVGRVVRGDSRRQDVYERAVGGKKIDWLVTSPPYYGMRTYIPDQWLRWWFLGGRPEVDHSAQGQMLHTSPSIFASQLRQVWSSVGSVCAPGAHMVVRFGGINDRKADPLLILKESLKDTGWSTKNIESAGSASKGQRQSLRFSAAKSSAGEEYDLWATWQGCPQRKRTSEMDTGS